MKQLPLFLFVSGGIVLAGETSPGGKEPVAEDPPPAAWETSFGGHAAAELRWFPSSPLDPRQEDFAPSLVLAPEWKFTNEDAKLTVTAAPFGRLDFLDDERTHADLREFNIMAKFDNSDLLVGVGKVFWGAMEAVHWVDVINQTDLIEDPDGEEKLGQPMINYNLYTDYGRFSFFALPGFRERTYPGPDGRLRLHPRIVADQAVYESGSEEWHIDFAARWSKTFGDLDVGLSYFHGTTREPIYLLGTDGDETVLQPLYEIVDQAGLDATYTTGDWLLKSEVMFRAGQGEEDFVRAAAGFEYTFHGIAGTRADLGVIGEFLYDSQGNNDINPFENDIVVGLRFAFNDLRDTTLLLSAITDPDDGSTFINLESSLRLGENWVVAAEARAFAGIPEDDFPLNGYRRDSYVQLGLEYHF
ncbi:MAG: hypothetical protein ACKO2G_12045 [Verrucomicrobiales bacterium]